MPQNNAQSVTPKPRAAFEQWLQSVRVQVDLTYKGRKYTDMDVDWLYSAWCAGLSYGRENP